MSETTTAFRQRLLRNEVLLGTFVKTPEPIVCEVLASARLDAICLDAEHAPFDRRDIDACVFALRAAGKTALVRVPVNAPEAILNALDCGATGVVVPHIRSVDEARAVARCAHFGPGGRGYAGSTRAAGFAGKSIARHRAESDSATTVIAQIEDLEALEAIDAIAAVDGIDCLFIGRIDLTVALQADSAADPKVIAAVERVCDAARRADRRVGMFVSDLEELPHWIARGATLFLLESDQVFLLAGARSLRKRFDRACEGP